MQVHIPSNAQGKLDVKGVVGGGNITVVRDLGLNENTLLHHQSYLEKSLKISHITSQLVNKYLLQYL